MNSDSTNEERGSENAGHRYPPLPSPESLGLPTRAGRLSGDALPKMGKFRFQLFAEWLAANFPPCRVADVGGGKGLLSYFLKQHGFDAVVIDPIAQPLPTKVKDYRSGQRIRFEDGQIMPRLSKPFTEEMVAGFDLIVALHAHGSNIKIIDACTELGKPFALLPCCVIDEPAIPPRSVNWFSWLSTHAEARGRSVQYFQLNFKGQNIGMYST